MITRAVRHMLFGALALAKRSPKVRSNPSLAPPFPLGADIYLEPRRMLSVTAAVDATPNPAPQFSNVEYRFTAEQTQQQIPVTVGDMFANSGQSINLSTGLTKVFDVETFGGVTYIAGEFNAKPAYVTVSSTGVLGSVQVLPSLDPNDPIGQVLDVALVNGSVTFIGESRVAGQNNQGFAWDLSGNPKPVPTTTAGGLLESANPVGIVVGVGESDHAAVGTLGGSLQLLPESGGFGGAVSITADGKWIVGGDGFGTGAWFSNDPSTLNYSLQTINFQTTATGDNPSVLRFVTQDPSSGHYLVFGEYVDSELFTDSVGVWDLSDGSLLRDFGTGVLNDVKTLGGHLVVSMNSINESYVTLLDSPEVVQVRDLIPGSSLLPIVSLTRAGFQYEDGKISLLVDTFDNNNTHNQQLLTFSYQPPGPPQNGPVTNATFHIDWNGDGVEDQVVTGDSGLTLTHSFSTVGAVTTRFWVEAADGERSDTVSTNVTITPVGPAWVQNGVLHIEGQDKIQSLGRGRTQMLGSQITVGPVGGGYQVHVGSFSQVFSGVYSIEISSGAASDRILVSAAVPVSIHSGAGNDLIWVNSPSSLVYAGAGNDTVFAFGGRAAVFGELGNDHLFLRAAVNLGVGGEGNDLIFISGNRSLAIGSAADFSPALVDQVFSVLEGSNSRHDLFDLLDGHVAAPARREHDLVLARHLSAVVVHHGHTGVFGRARRLRLH